MTPRRLWLALCLTLTGVPGAPWAALAAAQTSGETPATEPARPTGEAKPTAEPAPADEPGPSWWTDLGLRGALIYKNFSHFHDSPAGDGQFRNEGIFRLEWQRRLAAWASVKAGVEARGDDGDFTDGVYFRIPETGRRRSILNVREVVLRLRRDPVEVTLGKQVFAWGTGDAYNPTDLVNPYDALDPIDSEKMGVYSAAVRVTRGATSGVFVVVPAFTPTREPLQPSRWTPTTGADGPVVVDDRQVPSVELGHVQYAARVKTTLAGVDMSLSYFEGFERTPVLRLSSAVLAPGIEVPRVTPLYTRIRAPGADFATTWGPFEFHGEAAARFVASDGRDDRLQAIVGASYTKDDFDLRWLRHLVVGVEYAREIVFRRRTPSPFFEPPVVPGLGEGVPFRDALIGKVAVKLTEETSVKAAALVDLDQRANAFAQLKVSHKVTDALLLEGGVDLFIGRTDTIWGRWRDNDRFFAQLQHLF